MRSRPIDARWAALIWASIFAAGATACPFCAKMTRSATDDVRESAAVYFGELVRRETGTSLRVELAIRGSAGRGDELPIAGKSAESVAQSNRTRRLVYMKSLSNATSFELVRAETVSEAFASYLQRSWALADASGSTRLAYFFEHLGSHDARTAQDAYAEFAKASFRVTASAARAYNPERLRAWIENPGPAPDRVGLYGLLLGLCGSSADAEFLERCVRQPSADQKIGLDGLLGGWALLDVDQGEKLIVELLTSPTSSTLEKTSALSALRFLLSDRPPADPQSLLRLTMPALQDPELSGPLTDEMRKASLWEATGPVLARFSASRDVSAVVRFALVSPADEAKAFIEELRRTRIDQVRDAEQTLAFERSSRDLGR